jgi:CheY-like chemotaxis protein
MEVRAVARRLRFDPVTKNIPIFALMGMVDLSLGKSCLEAGCDDYLVKPVTHEALQVKLLR